MSIVAIKFTNGTEDKILDFFLRRKRVLAKYTKEEKQKAIDLYIRYCKQATKAIKNLTPLSTLPIGWIEVKDSAILRGLATHRTKFNHMLYLLQLRAPWRTVRRKASRKTI